MTKIELQKYLNLTRGPLNNQMKVLQEEGIVRIDKEFLEDRLSKIIQLEAEGERKFYELTSMLREFLESNNSRNYVNEASKIVEVSKQN